jgi:hypothetical protein
VALCRCRGQRGGGGGGRGRASRPFGYRVVMIAHACARGRFGVVGPTGQRRKVLPVLMGAAHRVFGGVAPLDL